MLKLMGKKIFTLKNFAYLSLCHIHSYGSQHGVIKGCTVVITCRLKEWRSMSQSDCLDKVEVLMRRKAVAVPDFPQEPVRFAFYHSYN